MCVSLHVGEGQKEGKQVVYLMYKLHNIYIQDSMCMCVSVCNSLWTTHRPKASLGEAWTWINYGPCMWWFCGRLVGGLGCYTCELRH